MGSVGGSADPNPFPDDINAILRDFLGYEPTENDFDCLLSSPDDGEVGDNFSMFDQMLDMADSEINLCRDMRSVNLNVPSNQWMEDNLINGDAQNYFNHPSHSPFDGAAFETVNLQINLFAALESVATFDPTVEDPGKQCAFDLEAADEGKAESSELKKKGVNLLCEAEAKGKELLDAKDVAEEKEALDFNDAEGKLKRKASITEFEPRKKSCNKHKGISLRLLRLKSGN